VNQVGTVQADCDPGFRATGAAANGRLPIGNIAFGTVSVSGRRRVPRPPTRTTAVGEGPITSAVFIALACRVKRPRRSESR
jgi:hypothetical protein